MRNRLTPLVLATALITSSGCASIWNMAHGRTVYGGVRMNAKEVARLRQAKRAAVFSLFDMPFSALADTFTLPWTLYRCWEAGEPER